MKYLHRLAGGGADDLLSDAFDSPTSEEWTAGTELHTPAVHGFRHALLDGPHGRVADARCPGTRL